MSGTIDKHFQKWWEEVGSKIDSRQELAKSAYQEGIVSKTQVANSIASMVPHTSAYLFGGLDNVNDHSDDCQGCKATAMAGGGEASKPRIGFQL